MPNNEVKLPKAEIDRTALEKFYREVWGFSVADARTEADIVIRRGPSSPIYQDRLSKAWQHLDFTGEGDAFRDNMEPQPAAKQSPVQPPKYYTNITSIPKNYAVTDPNKGFLPPSPPSAAPPVDPEAQDYPAAPYDPAMNPYGHRPSVNLPGAYPEDVMANPQFVDPAAYKAQQELNARREILNTPGFDPRAWAAQQALNERRAKLQKDAQVPISPAPLKAAKPTPAHLEDANLSSWQSLAGLLGY